MTKELWMLAGAGLGAGLMFMLDPVGGGRRRSIARDKAVRFGHVGARTLDRTARDLKNRAAGAVAEAKKIGADETVDDDTLVARVRTALGRVTKHTSAIAVVAKGDGVVELKGPILAGEHAAALTAVRGVRGVKAIDDDLEVHETPGSVPSLQ